MQEQDQTKPQEIPVSAENTDTTAPRVETSDTATQGNGAEVVSRKSAGVNRRMWRRLQRFKRLAQKAASAQSPVPSGMYPLRAKATARALRLYKRAGLAHDGLSTAYRKARNPA